MSNAVVGLFDPDIEARVRDHWGQLADAFGLDGMAAVPFPHLSWCVFDEFDPALVGTLSDLARTLTPIEVLADGWVLFAGPRPRFPAIVRHVVVHDAMLDARRTIFNACASLVTGVGPFMQPGGWTPHITCVTRGATPGDVAAVVEHLASSSPAPWTGHITRLGLIENPSGDLHHLTVDLPLGQA